MRTTLKTLLCFYLISSSAFASAAASSSSSSSSSAAALSSQNTPEEIYSADGMRPPHLKALTEWGNKYIHTFEPPNGKVSSRSCTFENVHITRHATAAVTLPTYLLFVEKSEVVDARFSNSGVTFKYSHDNVKENKIQSTFQSGVTRANTFNFALKASEPISAIGIDISAGHTETSTRGATSTKDAIKSEKDEQSFNFTLKEGGMYLLSTLHLIEKKIYGRSLYNMTANMTAVIEYVNVNDAEAARNYLSTCGCFNSVFLTLGINQEPNRLVLIADINTENRERSLVSYGPFFDGVTSIDSPIDQKRHPSPYLAVREFSLPIPTDETFLTNVVRSLNLVKIVDSVGTGQQGPGSERDTTQTQAVIRRMMPDGVSDQLIERIGRYL